MSISNLTQSIYQSGLDVKCDTMECRAMVFDEADVNTLDCEDVIINNNLSGVCDVNLENTFTDTSEVKILMNENLLGLGAQGVAMFKKGPDPQFQMFNCACNTFTLGGPRYLSQIGVENNVSGDRCVQQCYYDDVGLVLGQQNVLQVGLNNHTFGMTDANGIDIQSPVQIILNSPNIFMPQFISPSVSYNTSITTTSSGNITISRFQYDLFVVSGSDINRTSGLTSLKGLFNVNGDNAIVSFRFQITIGAGIGNPALSLDCPLNSINTTFLADDVIGAGEMSDVGLTSSQSLTVNAIVGTNSIRVDMIGASAGTYNCVIVCQYQVEP